MPRVTVHIGKTELPESQLATNSRQPLPTGIRLWLLDAEGRVLARTEKLGSVPDPAFLAAVKAALAKPAG